MSQKVRLQVQVGEGLANRLSELAKLLDRSQAWMGAELVVHALEDRNSLDRWILKRLGNAFEVPLRTKIENRDGEKVYLQIMVSKESAATVERLAFEMNQTVAKQSGWLIECAVHDHEWIIRFVSSRVGRALFQPLLKLHQSWFGERGKKEREELRHELKLIQKHT